MKTYPIPDALLAAAVTLIERLPASREVRAVLNGLEAHVIQHDKELAETIEQGRQIGSQQANQQLGAVQGGGGKGEPD